MKEIKPVYRNSIVQETDGILKELRIDAAKLIELSVSKSTRKNYMGDFAKFRYWCIGLNLDYDPASVETVVLYLTSLKEKKYSTIARAVTSINRIYQMAGLQSPVESPQVRSLLKGLRREIGIACEQTKPLSWQQVIRMVSGELPSFLGIRNKALISFAWCGAFRRSELCAMDIQDLERIESGFIVTIRKSKTDQEAEGVKVYIPEAPENSPVCPVRAVEALIARMNRTEGPLFMRSHRRIDDFFLPGSTDRLSSQSVTHIVKKMVRNIGLNPVNFSAHSLRRGFATEAAKIGIPERLIARQTRHKSMQVLRRYIDDGTLTQNNALSFIFSRHAAGRAPMPPQESPSHPETDPPADDPAELVEPFAGAELGFPFHALVE